MNQALIAGIRMMWEQYSCVRENATKALSGLHNAATDAEMKPKKTISTDLILLNIVCILSAHVI